MDVIIPHFDVPFRFEGSGVAVVEQDTPEDVANCVEAIVRTVRDTRLEDPEFGIPDIVLQEGYTNPNLIINAIQRWEPRAEATVTVDADAIDVLMERIGIEAIGGS